MKQIKSLVLVGITLAALLAIVPTYAAPPLPINVTTTDDELNADGDCSLREAIRAANLDQAVSGCTAGSGDDEIELQANATYTLTIAGAGEDNAVAGDLDFTSNVLITGNGATIQAGTTTANGIDRVFDVRSGNVTIIDAVIRHGRAMGGGGIKTAGDLTLIDSTVTLNTSPGGSSGGLSGVGVGSSIVLNHSTVSSNTATIFAGGILSQGGLTLTDSIVSSNKANLSGGGIYFEGNTLNITGSTISNNTADFDNSGSGDGGGIYMESNLVMTNSTVSGNDASDGGGIHNEGATATIIRSTISGNTATSAGGIRNQDNGTMKLVNSTISSNSASPGGAGGIANNPGTGTATGTRVGLFNVTIANNSAGGNGGGINNSATFEIRNSIIANNTAPSTKDCSGTLNSLGYNLIENTTGCTITGTTTGNKTGQDPALGALATNSGDTKTHALNSGSPAIDAGNPGGCVNQGGTNQSSDQRNFLRPVDGDSNGSAICDMGAYERLSPGTLTPTATATFTNTPTHTPTITNTPTRTHTPTRTFTPVILTVIGFVWNDLDQDGIREAGEPLMQGVTVELRSSDQTVLHDAVLTDATGSYSITGPPGSLRIKVNLPNGFTFAPYQQGTNGLIDSDILTSGANFGFSDIILQAQGGVVLDAGMFAATTNTNTPTRTLTPTRTRTLTPTATNTTTNGCTAKPAKPTLKAPPDNVTLANKAPQLKWNAATCATSYSVLVKNFETNKKADKATGLTKLKYKTQVLAPATKFKWNVKACNAFGCSKSGKRTFTTAP